jgi:hypothetical protein
VSIVSSDSRAIHNFYGTNDRAIIDPKTPSRFLMVSGLGVDARCRHWRFGPSHNIRAAPGHKRLVRAFLRYLSVSIDSVAGEKKSGHHPVGLDSFCHCLSYYHGRPPGLEDRRTRHVPDRSVTMLEGRLLLISVARSNTPAISSSHWQSPRTGRERLEGLRQRRSRDRTT